MFNMGSGFGNTGACRRSYSCLTQREKKKDAIRTLYIHIFFLNVEIKSTNLLLRKQFWMTLMMKDAASFSLNPGLNRCLDEETRFLTTTATSIEGSNQLIHISTKCKNILTHLSNLMVCPLKQGRPVSSMSVTKETTASM